MMMFLICLSVALSITSLVCSYLDIRAGRDVARLRRARYYNHFAMEDLLAARYHYLRLSLLESLTSLFTFSAVVLYVFFGWHFLWDFCVFLCSWDILVILFGLWGVFDPSYCLHRRCPVILLKILSCSIVVSLVCAVISLVYWLRWLGFACVVLFACLMLLQARFCFFR